MLFAQKNSECPRRFERPWNLTRVLWAPSQPMTNVLFFRRNFGSIKTQIPQIKISEKKKTSTAWQGLLGHVYQFQGHLKKTKKRRGNWMLIWSDMLEPACTRVVYRLHRKIFYYFMRAKSVSCIIHGSIYTRTDCIRIRTRDRSTWCVVRRTYYANSRELQD